MDKLQYLVKTFSRTTKKDYENYVINAIYQRVGNLNLQPVTQQYVRLGKNKYAKIDLYFPQIGIAVEVDEAYHLSETQAERDKERESEVAEKLKKDKRLAISAISLETDAFRRVKVAFNETDDEVVGWKEVERQINEIVAHIQNKITEYENVTNKELNWEIKSSEQKINRIRKDGKLFVGEGFSTVSDILKVFGKEVKNPRKCFFYSDSGYEEIWSPTLSVDLGNGIKTDSNGWQNELHYDANGISEIVETYVGTDLSIIKNRYKFFKEEKDDNVLRLTFAFSKDALGIAERRFIGAFKPSSIENNNTIHYTKYKGLSGDNDSEYFIISDVTVSKLRQKREKAKNVMSIYEKQKAIEVFVEPDNIDDFMIIKVRDEIIEERHSRLEATRYCWKISLAEAKKRNYVLSVTDGIVRAVYKVNEWFEATGDYITSDRDIGRVMFEGEEVTDKSICDRFLNKMIPEKYRKKGMASPCVYCKK
jgi:hypothetical protein